jgi:hypothetical protein
MDLSTLFEIIGKYGWWSLLIAACMGLIYICVKLVANKITDGVKGGMDDIANKLTGTVSNQLQEMSSTNSSQLEMLSQNIAKQNNELVKAISNQNEKLLSYIMNYGKAAQDIHDKYVEERMNIAETINNKLKEIMYTAHSQRAFIIEFHNSYKNLAGSPFAKYTCTYEWFDKGLEQISTKIVALPYSTMAKIVGDVRRTGKHQIIYTDMIKMEEENPQLFSLLKDTRTLAVYYRMLYDEHNKMMGMLVLEWQQDFDLPIWKRAKMTEYLTEECIKISNWLNIQGPLFNTKEIDDE